MKRKEQKNSGRTDFKDANDCLLPFESFAAVLRPTNSHQQQYEHALLDAF
jgi:hypothetical protein